jgi:hypothetical protein
MPKFTRDKDKLGGDPFVQLRVDRSNEASRSNEVKAAVWLRYQKEGKDNSRGRAPLRLPIEQAVEEACRVAESEGISVIWIDDPDQMCDMALSQ